MPEANPCPKEVTCLYCYLCGGNRDPNPPKCTSLPRLQSTSEFPQQPWDMETILLNLWVRNLQHREVPGSGKTPRPPQPHRASLYDAGQVLSLMSSSFPCP